MAPQLGKIPKILLKITFFRFWNFAPPPPAGLASGLQYKCAKIGFLTHLLEIQNITLRPTLENNHGDVLGLGDYLGQ